jgi:hypothetical protein
MTNKKIDTADTNEIVWDTPSRYNEELADEGVWFSVYDEDDRLWGKFKCAMYDADSRRFKQAFDRLKTKYAKEIRTKSTDAEKMGAELFLDAVLLDWEEVTVGGKEFAFTRANAELYFAHKPHLKFALPKLLEFSQDVRNYQAAPKDEIAGN